MLPDAACQSGPQAKHQRVEHLLAIHCTKKTEPRSMRCGLEEVTKFPSLVCFSRFHRSRLVTRVVAIYLWTRNICGQEETWGKLSSLSPFAQGTTVEAQNHRRQQQGEICHYFEMISVCCLQRCMVSHAVCSTSVLLPVFLVLVWVLIEISQVSHGQI